MTTSRNSSATAMPTANPYPAYNSAGTPPPAYYGGAGN
jgi:hypothetical protein